MNTEICFSYGETKGNMDFFMNYGFLTPANNDVDYMLIKMELDEEDPAYQLKASRIAPNLWV
jgi:hypothetical protein